MEVTSKYQLPFNSEFDYRVTLFQQLYDYMTQAAVEIIVENEKENSSIDWKNFGAILEYAVAKGYFNKVGQRAMELAAKRVDQDS